MAFIKIPKSPLLQYYLPSFLIDRLRKFAKILALVNGAEILFHKYRIIKFLVTF